MYIVYTYLGTRSFEKRDLHICYMSVILFYLITCNDLHFWLCSNIIIILFRLHYIIVNKQKDNQTKYQHTTNDYNIIKIVNNIFKSSKRKQKNNNHILKKVTNNNLKRTKRENR